MRGSAMRFSLAYISWSRLPAGNDGFRAGVVSSLDSETRRLDSRRCRQEACSTLARPMTWYAYLPYQFERAAEERLEGDLGAGGLGLANCGLCGGPRAAEVE